MPIFEGSILIEFEAATEREATERLENLAYKLKEILGATARETYPSEAKRCQEKGSPGRAARWGCRMRDERSFYDGRTEREEARLWRDSDGWSVWSREEDNARYPGTDEGYAQALADYQSRVARAMTRNGRAGCA